MYLARHELEHDRNFFLLLAIFQHNNYKSQTAAWNMGMSPFALNMYISKLVPKLQVPNQGHSDKPYFPPQQPKVC